jgi:hypothetical protein
VTLRGREDDIALGAGGAAASCAGVIESIVRTTGRAWKAAEGKIGLQGSERDAWNREGRVFLLGGGGDFKPLRDRVRYSNFARQLMPIQVLEQPTDLRAGPGAVAQQDLRFLMSAYGLSVIGLAIPEVDEADDLGPAETALRRRHRLEWDDPYSK